MGFESFKQNYSKLWFSQLDLHDVEPDLGREPTEDMLFLFFNRTLVFLMCFPNQQIVHPDNMLLIYGSKEAAAAMVYYLLTTFRGTHYHTWLRSYQYVLWFTLSGPLSKNSSHILQAVNLKASQGAGVKRKWNCLICCLKVRSISLTICSLRFSSWVSGMYLHRFNSSWWIRVRHFFVLLVSHILFSLSLVRLTFYEG